MTQPATQQRLSIPRTLTIDIDTREQIPALFPGAIRVPSLTVPTGSNLIQLATRSIKLECGDYRLAEYPDVSLIERKASQLELLKNLFNPLDAARQGRSFAKLAVSCRYPCLMVEASPASLLAKPTLNTGISVEPELVLARLSQVTAHYGFHLFFVNSTATAQGRRTLGTFIAHLLVGYALMPLYHPEPVHIIPQIPKTSTLN